MVVCVPHDKVDVFTFQVYCRDQTGVSHVISYLKCDIMVALRHHQFEGQFEPYRLAEARRRKQQLSRQHVIVLWTVNQTFTCLGPSILQSAFVFDFLHSLCVMRCWLRSEIQYFIWSLTLKKMGERFIMIGSRLCRTSTPARKYYSPSPLTLRQ